MYKYYGLTAAHLFRGVTKRLELACDLSNSHITVSENIKAILMAHPNIHTKTAYIQDS